MTFTKKVAALASTTALASIMIGCGTLVANCNQAACNTQPTQPTQPTPTCNQDMISADADLTSLPQDANGNPVISTEPASVATAIQSCGLEPWNPVNPQDQAAGAEFTTFYTSNVNGVRYVDLDEVKTTAYTNYQGDPSIEVGNTVFKSRNNAIVVGNSEYDHYGDTGQNGVPFTAPLLIEPAVLARGQSFAAANNDSWDFTGTYTANQQTYDEPMAIDLGQGYADAIGGLQSTQEGGLVAGIIQKLSGVEINPTGQSSVPFIPYATYQAGPAAIAAALNAAGAVNGDGVFITHADVYFQGTNPTNGQSYPIQGTGWFDIFVKSGNQFSHISLEPDGDGRVIATKGGAFTWGDQAESPLGNPTLGNPLLFTLDQANTIAKAFGQTFTNAQVKKHAALEKPMFFSNQDVNGVLALNSNRPQMGVFDKNAPAGQSAYKVHMFAAAPALGM